MSKLTVKPIVLSRSVLISVMGPSACLTAAERAVTGDLKSLGQEFNAFEADALSHRFHEEAERVKLRPRLSR